MTWFTPVRSTRGEAEAERGDRGRAGGAAGRPRLVVARDGPAASVRAPGPLGRSSLLEAMVQERPSALGRLHALWTLELLGSLDTRAILAGLDDAEPRVREQAIRLAETRLDARAGLAGKAAGPGRRSRPDGAVSARVFAGRGQRRSARDRGPGVDRRARTRPACGPAPRS